MTKQYTWNEIVEPIVKQFKLAGMFDQSTLHNAKASAALASIIQEMADKLDSVIDKYPETRPNE